MNYASRNSSDDIQFTALFRMNIISRFCCSFGPLGIAFPQRESSPSIHYSCNMRIWEAAGISRNSSAAFSGDGVASAPPHSWLRIISARIMEEAGSRQRIVVIHGDFIRQKLFLLTYKIVLFPQQCEIFCSL